MTEKTEEIKKDEPILPIDEPEEDKESLGETAKTIVIAVLLALLVRTFLYEPFNILRPRWSRTCWWGITCSFRNILMATAAIRSPSGSEGLTDA